MHGHTERVVVTGGAGFIGSHLVERLLLSGTCQVTVLDDFSRGQFLNLDAWLTDSRLTVIQGDVRDRELVRDALDGAAIIYHLAARSPHGTIPGESDDVFTTNVIGTFNVLRTASDVLARRVVFASSYDAYGIPLSLPVDEDHPLHTVELYGASKVAGEAYCRAFRRVFGLQTVVIRLGEVFGPRDMTGRVAHWIALAERGQDLTVPDKDEMLDFIWIDQVVDALLQAGIADVLLPPINVASGTGTRSMDIARRIARLSDGQPRVKALKSASTDVRRFVSNVERMRRLLGIEPSLDPLQHLAEIVPAPRLVTAS